MARTSSDLQLVDTDNNPINPAENVKVSSATTSGAVTVGSTSTSVLTANSSREEVILVNDSDQVIYINFSGTAVMNQGIRLNANGGMLFNNSYTGAITAICASGGKNLTVTQL